MKYLILILLTFTSVFAQLSKTAELIGVAKLDEAVALENIKQNTNAQNKIIKEKKSTILAGILSAALPGAGEIYNENYLKAALFFAAEVAAVSVDVIYNRKGDDQTAFFEDYAQKHWSVARYALWTITNLQTLNPSLDPNNYQGLFEDANKTKVNWNVLNKLESDIGGYYSHRLAHFGEQQYYEMIGKYPQFNPGWDDFGDEHTPYKYGDPITEHYKYYSGLRGKANNFYYIADTAVIVVIINHILSAIDAIWTSAKYNRRLKARVSLEKQTIGYGYVLFPKLNLSLNF